MFDLSSTFIVILTMIPCALGLDGIARRFPENALTRFVSQPMLESRDIANQCAGLSTSSLNIILGPRKWIFFHKRSFFVSVLSFVLAYFIAWWFADPDSGGLGIANLFDYSSVAFGVLIVSLILVSVANSFSFHQTFELYRLAATSSRNGPREQAPSVFQIFLVIVGDLSITLMISVLSLALIFSSIKTKGTRTN